MAVTVKTDLTIIKIKWGEKVYVIKAEGVKDSDKQDIEKTYATDSHDPNYVTFGKCEFSIDLNGVQNFRWLFERIREVQTSGSFAKKYPALSTYKYNNQGKVVMDKYYADVFVEEISGENQDPFDVKLVPMRRVYRDSKKKTAFIGAE